jgi:UDP-3-O-[3-hydroxymyristoyl] glucosamine N-acyltransferase
MTSLAQLASHFDLAYEGDGEVDISRVATLSGAQPGEISFFK